MAATKKASSTKKPAKKSVAAKSVAKRTVAKAAPKKSAKKSVAPKQAAHRSFRPSRASEPFFTIRINHQTLYWLILAALVIGLALWVLSISVKVQEIYDQVDMTSRLDTSSATQKAPR